MAERKRVALNPASYRIGFEYYPLPGRGGNIELGLLVDGEYPADRAKSLSFPRTWEDAGGPRADANGNEFTAEQREVGMWKTGWASDQSGNSAGGFTFALSSGRHEITVESLSEPFALKSVLIAPPEQPLSYRQAAAEYREKGYADYQGDPIIVEGEKAAYKSSASLIALSDNSDPGVNPSSPYINKLNYIGSNNWKTPGDTITWRVSVKKSGLYRIGFHYRQRYLLNGNSYRLLRIDGKIPFEEAKAVCFGYGGGWNFQLLENDGGPMLLYLHEGEHLLSLEVTMGPVSGLVSSLQDTVQGLGEIYRRIVMITGEIPDANRDYNLFRQIPDLRKRLENARKTLDGCAAEFERLSGKSGGTNSSVLRNMSGVIRRMLNYSYQIQQYKSDYYTNYCSVSAWLYEMRNMPLDMDSIVLAAPEGRLDRQGSGLLKKAGFSVQRFLASFVMDYNSISGSGEGEENITLWLNWGRDQAKTLSFMIQSDFTPKHGVGVNIKLVNATLVQAILSGNGPDCSLHMSRGEPVNLAMRGALKDLTGFEDYAQVIKRFMPGSTIPYEYNGGCYGLPDTQYFNMLFYRTDIFKEIGLDVPKTWDEFLYTSTILQRYNMQVGVPYTQITDMGQINVGIGALNMYPTLMQQFGESLYNGDRTATALTTAGAIRAFTFWTDLYTKYDLPLTFDFYNRFRTGQMPMGIAPYLQYAVLSVAAPEIEGRWDIAPIPGMRKEDGEIDHSEAGGGSACVILKGSKKQEAAWKFLKWWTSAEVQSGYSKQVESVLGIAARVATATADAFTGLSWDSEGLKQLQSQWSKVTEVPEIPGSYYVSRVIDQAFWNTVNNGKTPKDMIVEWSRVADEEIARKREEYPID